MICAATSSVARYLDGDSGHDVDLVAAAIENQELVLSPITVTELLSHTGARPLLDPLLRSAPMLPITDGFWERAGLMRRLIRSKGFKAKLADTLIAQCCVDARAPLITHDPDFRHFATHCGLKLAD